MESLAADFAALATSPSRPVLLREVMLEQPVASLAFSRPPPGSPYACLLAAVGLTPKRNDEDEEGEGGNGPQDEVAPCVKVIDVGKRCAQGVVAQWISPPSGATR